VLLRTTLRRPEAQVQRAHTVLTESQTVHITRPEMLNQQFALADQPLELRLVTFLDLPHQGAQAWPLGAPACCTNCVASGSSRPGSPYRGAPICPSPQRSGDYPATYGGMFGSGNGKREVSEPSGVRFCPLT
jgi:hypothetical protein